MIPAAGAALAYGTAAALDGSGFIAAFVAGMTPSTVTAHLRGRDVALRALIVYGDQMAGLLRLLPAARPRRRR